MCEEQGNVGWDCVDLPALLCIAGNKLLTPQACTFLCLLEIQVCVHGGELCVAGWEHICL